MEDKNIKRRNEVLKEVAEAQQEIADFNQDIEMDICKINHVLMYGDYTQREECRIDIARKHPNYAQYLDNRTLLLNLICSNTITLLTIQKQALINKKTNRCFQEYINRGAKCGIKWKIEDTIDRKIGK